jgi:hypothetical protein
MAAGARREEEHVLEAAGLVSLTHPALRAGRPPGHDAFEAFDALRRRGITR